VSAPKICKNCFPAYNKQIGEPAKFPLKKGETRICVAGYTASPHYTRANNCAITLSQEFPDTYKFWGHGTTRDEFFVWLVGFKETLPKDSPFQKHKTSPLCWFEKDDGTLQVVGGRDMLVAWISQSFPGSKADKKGDSIVSPFESNKQAPPPKGTVPAGKIRICVGGYSASPNYTRGHNVACLIVLEYPDKFEHWTFAPMRDEYFKWLKFWKNDLPQDSPYKKHKTAPIVWFEKDDGSVQVIGGRDMLVAWVKQNYPGSKADTLGDKGLNIFEANM